MTSSAFFKAHRFKKKKKKKTHEIAEYAKEGVISVTSHSHFVNPMDRGVPETYSRIMNVKKIPVKTFYFCKLLFIFFFLPDVFCLPATVLAFCCSFFQT